MVGGLMPATTTATAVSRMRDDLMSGRTFTLVAMSERSRFGYQPPLSRRSWAHIMQTLGKMAGRSDPLAQIAQAIVGKVNLYGTDGDARAKVYDEAAMALAAGYDDVIGRAGPEAGRYSDHQRGFTLEERAQVLVWLAEATAPVMSSVPGIGWAMAALIEEDGLRVPHPSQTPSLKGRA